jgi:PhoPQ-activated pathogenicity-related protein
MMGLSGGGWTTTLAAALDERIEASFPVAGSLPLNIRTGESVGDWEQMLPGISHLVSYEDLYVMATSSGRRQMQVLNLHDPCCFASDGAAYRDEVSAATGGQWSLFVDEQQRTHDISPQAMEKIIGSIVSRETK